jgi:hypothetical protein
MVECCLAAPSDTDIYLNRTGMHTEGDTKGTNPFWRLVRNALLKPTKQQASSMLEAGNCCTRAGTGEGCVPDDVVTHKQAVCLKQVAATAVDHKLPHPLNAPAGGVPGAQAHLAGHGQCTCPIRLVGVKHC